jgi:Family of unknown function (DUF6252)
MPERFTYPVLLSVAGLLFFLLPFVPLHKGVEAVSELPYSGDNTLSFHFNDSKIVPTAIQTEVTHSTNLFSFNLWIGDGCENRITFVLNDEEIHERVYDLNNPSKRYFSFLYHGQHCSYSSDDNQTGMLMIHKYDTTNKIIAGSFEFMAYSDDCDELVRVNNGQFDATYTLH